MSADLQTADTILKKLQRESFQLRERAPEQDELVHLGNNVGRAAGVYFAGYVLTGLSILWTTIRLILAQQNIT